MWLMSFVLAVAIPSVPARALPHHVLDRNRTTLVAEAGDAVVIRLPETVSEAWRQRVQPPAATLVPVGPVDGVVRGGHREFAYRLRGAGRSTAVFRRGGGHPETIVFTIHAR